MWWVESSKRGMEAMAINGHFVGFLYSDELNWLKFKYCSRSIKPLSCRVYKSIVYPTKNRRFG